MRYGKVKERLQDKHAGNEQRPAHHPADTLLRLRATKRPVNYARACFENVALVALRGQSKTVFGKARPKRPYGTKRPDLLRAQPIFVKRATTSPSMTGANMPKRGNQGTWQKSLKHRQRQE